MTPPLYPPQAQDLTSETTDYEEKEQQLMMVCVEETQPIQ